MSAQSTLRALCCSVVTAAMVAAAEPAAAQAPAALPIADGTRARVTAPALGPSRRVATVIAQRGDTLVLRSEGALNSVAVPLAGVTGLEVSRGRHTRVRRGLAVGLVTGAVVGAVASYAAYKPDTCGETELGCFLSPLPEFSRSDETVLGAIGGGLLGAAVGSVVGLAWRTERWERVSLPPRIARVRLAPTPGGGLAIGVAF